MKIVCFSEIQWRYVKTRKQQILGRFPEDWEILFLSSVVAGKPNNFRPIKDGRVTHVCVPVFKNFPPGAVRALFARAIARFLWNIALFAWVKIVLLATGFSGRSRVFYVSNIYYAAVLRFFPRNLLLYDCNDDPLEFPNAPRWAQGYFRSLVRQADIVTAVSSGLEEKVRALGGRDVHRIGNGVDYELFLEAMAAGEPEEFKDLPRPIIGYSGAIAQWFDMELLGLVATAFPRASVVLFGPLFEPRREELSEKMARCPNIRYLGVMPYERLGAYIGALDVCMAPLRRNELMKMADPNKLYEYAAAGKPIVSMKFAGEMEALSGLMYLAESEEEFIEGIRRALGEGANAAGLREFAMRNSWKSRAGEMAALIRSSAAAKAQGERGCPARGG